MASVEERAENIPRHAQCAFPAIEGLCESVILDLDAIRRIVSGRNSQGMSGILRRGWIMRRHDIMPMGREDLRVLIPFTILPQDLVIPNNLIFTHM